MTSEEIEMKTFNTGSTSHQVRLAEQGHAELLAESIKEIGNRALDALANRNIEEFRSALKNGADPLVMDDENLSIHEKALQTSGASQFVEECLKAGCDPNHINSHYNKAAINFAIESKDPENLKILLSKPDVQLGHIHETLSPLFINITDFYSYGFIVPNCVKVLLEYAACINKSKQIEILPLFNFVKTLEHHNLGTSFLVEELLKVPNINIDADGNGELRHILGKAYPAIRLPAISQSTEITFYTLLNCLRDNDMEMFVQQYRDETRYTTKQGDAELFAESIKRRANRAFDVMLEKGVDMNKLLVEGKTPLEIACIFGNSHALGKLLKRSYIESCSNEMFHEILCKLNDENYRKQFDDYWNCFYMLLDSNKVNINGNGSNVPPALYYAVKLHNNRAIRELLKRGAILYYPDSYSKTLWNGISPSILEEHFDDCISSNQAKHKEYGDKDFKITIDFKNFLIQPKQLNVALSPIEFMAKVKEYRHLLKHPVINSILYLKWKTISLIFYINFFLYMFFAISVIAFSILRFPASSSEHGLARRMARYCSLLGICYLMIREFLQFILSPLNYLCRIINYMEISLIVLSLATVCGDTFKISTNWQCNIAVHCIFLLAIELILLVGTLPFPSISMHMLMLKAVCKSFLNIFLLHSIFIVTFTLCFYIKGDGQPIQKANFTESEYNEEAFHKFSNPMSAFIKTIVMFTGDFDASSMTLDSNYWLFFLFVLFMTVILFNLLCGLVVSDTQAIKNEAELNEIIYRLNLLRRFQKTFIESIVHNLQNNYCSKFKLYFCDILHFFDFMDRQISILPNDKNRILKPDFLEPENKEAGTKGDVDNNRYATQLKNWYWLLTKFSCRFDKKISAQAMIVLEKKSYSTIESSLGDINKKLDDIIEETGSLCHIESSLGNVNEKINTIIADMESLAQSRGYEKLNKIRLNKLFKLFRKSLNVIKKKNKIK